MPKMQRETEHIAFLVDYVHRYWVRTFGQHPHIDESVTIIGVIAALDEMHALHCSGSFGPKVAAIPPLVPPQPKTRKRKPSS